MVYGVEIVAFVSSVGNIRISTHQARPKAKTDADAAESGQLEDDETEEPSEEYLSLLGSITREDVDRNAVRCPVPETADLMTQVRRFAFVFSIYDRNEWRESQA